MKSSEVNRWLTLIHLSQEERKEKQPGWEDYYKYFRGIQWDVNKEQTKDIITVNLVYSHLKVIVPSIYAKNPKIYFEANKASSVDKARLTEFILNRDIQATNLKYTNKDILQDVILYGTGWSKTTYELYDVSDTIDMSTRQENEGVEAFYNLTGAGITEELRVPKSGPRILRCSPYDINFAVGATDPGDPGFISHKVRKRLYTIKNDTYYKNTKDLQPTVVASDTARKKYMDTWNSEVDEYLAMVDMYEIWNPETGRFFTLAEGHDKPLRDEEENPYPYDHPFDRLIFTRLEGQMWGFSEIDPWIPQLDELNKNRSQLNIHTKRYNRKYVAVQNAFVDEEDKSRLESGEDGVVVFVRGDNVNNAITTLQDAPMPADVYRYGGIIEGDLNKIAGIPSYRRTDDKIGADTATEATIIESASKARDADRIDNIAEFVLNQMEKVRQARARYTPGMQTLEMTDDLMATKKWEDWSKEDIDIHSEMRIEYGGTLPINQTTRRNDALMLYDRAMANPTVNQQSAFNNLLEAFDVRDQTKWFLPQAIVQMQMMQKALAGQLEGKGVSAQGGTLPGPGSEPGNVSPETGAELRGRAASAP